MVGPCLTTGGKKCKGKYKKKREALTGKGKGTPGKSTGKIVGRRAYGENEEKNVERRDGFKGPRSICDISETNG